MKEIFIAYQGCEYNEDEIIKVLEDKISTNRDLEIKTCYLKKNNVIYAKIVKRFVFKAEPDLNEAFLTVSGFDIIKAYDVSKRFMCDIKQYDYMYRIISDLYGRFEEKIFEKLSPYMNFCSVIYEIEENTYMKDGILFTLDGKKIESNISNSKQNPILIKNSRQNSESIIAGLNDLLLKMTEELVRTNVENNINSFLPLEEIKQKISNYISDELNNETKKQILTIIKDELKNFNLKEEITTELGNLINKKIVEYTNNITIPTVHVIKLKDKILGQTKSGFYHKSFEEILEHVELDEPIMLIGPAGSGKNVSIAQVADALGKKMYYTNNASNEFKLTGFIDAGGNYRQTEFYKAFKNGGVFFLDEIDCSDPSALIVINSALANGYMAFPHETIDKHPDFRIITAANTWGKGADLEYVGRNSLDASTLDRFDTIFFEYDENLEQSLYPNNNVLEFMWSFRRAVLESRIHHIVSTRGIGKVYKKEINGISVERSLTSNIVKNLNQDDVNTIIGNMKNVSSSNKYYEGIKCLKLKR